MSDANKCLELKRSTDCSMRVTPDNDADSGDHDTALTARQTLCHRAEINSREGTFEPALENLSQEAMHFTMHELRVHQVELEMQNEELRRIQYEADEARERYFDLYDLAPVGYFTISENGLILQANLTGVTMLGVSRRALVKQPMTRFIEKADQDVYYLLRQRLLATGEAQSCELRMWKKDGAHFWAAMAVTTAVDADRAPDSKVLVCPVNKRPYV